MGKHLVAAGGLIDVDPEAALKHARYAKAKASRVPIVREALGLVSYHAGNWAEALSELRAVRRMTKTDTHIAVIADAERALGRPERALDLAKETNVGQLPREVEVELRIVAAGARRDLGQLDAAVVSLQTADLDATKRDPWSARLFYAYADNLAAAGRREEAVQWFLNAAAADEDEETDAAERAEELSADPADLAEDGVDDVDARGTDEATATDADLDGDGVGEAAAAEGDLGEDDADVTDVDADLAEDGAGEAVEDDLDSAADERDADLAESRANATNAVAPEADAEDGTAEPVTAGAATAADAAAPVVEDGTDEAATAEEPTAAEVATDADLDDETGFGEPKPNAEATAAARADDSSHPPERPE
ncbi:hypothetical protein [Amycolatopsis acididurans]|uniref:hypothetical protein n=1 Tax=Amycolatopsis acididurans TaxID=2724524 RepID=UPI0024833FAA|nr:hypothetical protein [Amycolatopsis acididurans]